MEIKSGIYQIRNTVNGKVYVGSGVVIADRWSDHRHYLKINKHHNPHLQRAWNKYGPDAFEFSVLELCSISALTERENAWCAKFKREEKYNIREVAESNLGFKHSAETIAKISSQWLSQPPLSFSRVDRRMSILHASARRLMNDPAATWNNFMSQFTDAIYPLGVLDADLTEPVVRAALEGILREALLNLERGSQSGPAKDLREIGIAFPRRKRVRKID